MSSLQLDDDTEERLPRHSPTNDSSPRVSTPLSFQTFGAQQASSHPRDGVQRPSFDSAQSSSPSTEPPSTPLRQDTSPVIQPSSMSSKATLDAQTADRPLNANRRFRIHNPADIYRTTPDSPSPSTPLSPPPPPRTTKQDDVNINEPTLRRIAKRRGRPALGVATYAPSASNVVVEASPLSPVVASPRSTMFQVASQTPTPAANANFQIGSPELPTSPDVTLDLSQDPDMLVSPKGTRHITTPPAPEKYVHYKPRKRIIAPRKRSFVSGPIPDQIFQPVVLDETPQTTLRKWSFSSKPESPSASSTLLRRFSKFTLSSSTTAMSGGPTSRKASTDEGHGYASEDTGSRRLSIGRRLSHFVTGSRRQSFADTRPAPESPDRRKVIMIQSHLSRPHPPLLQTPSTEGSSTLHHPSQPSTVTVRSSDGWYSTIPSSLTTQESVLSNVEPILDLESPEEPAGLRPFRNASSSSVVIPSVRQHVQRVNNGSNTVSQSMPPSPIGPSAASGFPRPVSYQSRRFSGNGSMIHDPLGGVPEPDGSVRLLDAATAAAIRRSVDFDDRVKRSEDMLRAAIYGPTVSASPRSSTVSINRTSMDRGRGGKTYQSSRSQSLDNRHGHHRIRTGSFGNAHSTTNGRDTRGGVFLPSSLEHPDDDEMIKRPIARANTTLSYVMPTRHESATPVPVMTHLPKIDDNHHHYTTMPATTCDPPLPLRHRIGNKISRIFTGKPN